MGRFYLALVLLGLSAPARATPSEAAGLGGLDLYYPAELDTFMYFDTDLNLFSNPALAHRYRNQVQANLGFSGGGLAEGMGIDPRALGLFGIGDAVTLGFALNRSTGEYGEKAAIGNVLDALMVGSTLAGELGGGTFQDPLATGSVATELQPPLDLFASFAVSDRAVVGLNLYAAFGSSGADTNTELTPGGETDDWTRARAFSRSSWLGATAGLALAGESTSAEAWLRFTGASSWTDAQAWDAAERGNWSNEDDLFLDRTAGLAGTNRFGGGVRATFAASDTVELTPAVLADVASGRTFAVDRLANDVADPEESLTAQAEDDTLRARAFSLRAGVGVTFRPTEPLKVVTTVAVDVQTTGVLFDNNAQDAQVPGSVRVVSEDRAVTLRLPVVSLGGEYAFSEAFAVRGAARATTLFNRVQVTSLDQTATEAQGWTPDPDTDAAVAFDGGPVPTVTAAIGPSIRLGDARLEGVLGGLMTGVGDDFFSRIDAVFSW